jgi:hypothetical protein
LPTAVETFPKSGKPRADTVEATESGRAISINVSHLLPEDSGLNAVLVLKPIIFDESDPFDRLD